MKKYIWITMYFIGLVWFSYTFFYISWNNKQNLDNSQKESKSNVLDEKIEDKSINEIVDNITNNNKEEKQQIQDIEKNIEKNIELKDNWKQITWDNTEIKNNKQNTTGNNNQYVENNNIENIELEYIYIGLTKWKLVKDSRYEDIYNILNLSELPLYKIEDKDIYIKELKSIEYEEKKSNMSELIQKIWGNIIETNLFWNKQLFVNIDVYYKKQSIMLVSYEWKTYVLILPYEKYQDYKKYLKEFLFVN